MLNSRFSNAFSSRFISTTRKTLTAAITTVMLSVPAFSAQAAAMPPAPEIGAKGYLLLDLTTNQTLANFNSTERLEPASLTKLMTGYIVFSALQNKTITLDQLVNVSPTAWKAEGSRMFIEPNKPVSVQDLLLGMIVQSGNDATRALAELLAGDEANFATLMNQQAKRLGLVNSNFKNATGLPDPQHYTTAADLALLAKRIILDFPQYYKMYSTKEFTYNNIKQPNRNRLLWIDPSVDGMKTGHTDAAGYCLVSSAQRRLPNGVERRLVSVVMGTASDQARTQESLKLFNYGYQMFETARIFTANQTVATSKVYKGKDSEIKIGVTKELLLNVPRGMSSQISTSVTKKDNLIAPIKAGTELGTVTFKLDNEVVGTSPLVALNSVDEAGLIGRTIDSVKLWIGK